MPVTLAAETDLAIGLHQLRCRAATGNPFDQALLHYVQDLEALLAAGIPPGPCSQQAGCTCPADTEADELVALEFTGSE